MDHSLSRLVELARRVEMTPEQKEAQRRSLAYGNTALENDRITREMIDRQADAIDSQQ